MTTHDTFDVLVAGAGPAGSAAAATLARAGLSVILVDRDRRPTLLVGESLPPVATSILAELGVAHRMRPDHEPSYGTQSAWGDDALADADYIFDPRGHGWRLDRIKFDRMLVESAIAAGARMLRAQVRNVTRNADGGVTVVAAGTGGEQRMRARFVVDATGRPARVARALGAERRDTDRLAAFAATFAAADGAALADRDSRVLVESVPEGWWYTARLPQGQRLAVFLTDASSAAARRSATANGFDALLDATRHVGARVRSAGVARTSPPAAFRANSAALGSAGGESWIAVGDAAASFDPLSGQGIYTALYTGVVGARAIVSHAAGEAQALEAYAGRVRSIVDAYRSQLARYYATERRWPTESFWCVHSTERNSSSAVPRL